MGNSGILKTKRMIPLPIMFNPVKHHLGYIKSITGQLCNSELLLKKTISHVGASVTDIYTGSLDIDNICSHVINFLVENSLNDKNSFCLWAGIEKHDFRKIILPDNSEWALKFFDHPDRFVHLFPARNSNISLRVKGTSLKTAILWFSQPGTHEINTNYLNQIRISANLSPVKSIEEANALANLIRLLGEV
jgi:hypothetical protein